MNYLNARVSKLLFVLTIAMFSAPLPYQPKNPKLFRTTTRFA